MGTETQNETLDRHTGQNIVFIVEAVNKNRNIVAVHVGLTYFIHDYSFTVSVKRPLILHFHVHEGVHLEAHLEVNVGQAGIGTKTIGQAVDTAVLIDEVIRMRNIILGMVLLVL